MEFMEAKAKKIGYETSFWVHKPSFWGCKPSFWGHESNF